MKARYRPFPVNSMAAIFAIALPAEEGGTMRFRSSVRVSVDQDISCRIGRQQSVLRIH
jgi:hypothetical protein